jgi:hypothetical protein
MRYRLLVLTVTLIMVSIMGFMAGPPAWAQQPGGEDCSDHEGDHGRDCLPTPKDECSVFEHLVKNRDLCM